MAALVSHAMHRFPTSPPDTSYSSYGLRRESNNRNGGDASARTSTGSTGALSRSMRYAEPWLYGSVGTSGGLLLAPALVLCHCPDYLTGSRRSASKKSHYTCKRCKGTRLPLSPVESKFGTVRCYPTAQQVVPSTPLRAGTVRVTSTSRPSILPASDPYDLMRRSRLSVPETTSNVSPFKERVASPSKGTFKKTTSKNKSANKPDNATFGRKSILECDVNPYELMSNESLGESKDKSTKSKQRVKIKSSDKDYEDVQIPRTNKTKGSPGKAAQKKPSPVRSISTPTKGSEDDTKTSVIANGFKSILKKKGASESPYSDVEEATSPKASKKAGSKFYVPVPARKKVQFLDAGKSDSSEEDYEEEKDATEDENKIAANNNNTSENIEKYAQNDVCEKVVESDEQIDQTVIPPNKKEDNLEPKRKIRLYRSNSDRSRAGEKNVNFYDTMALRQNKRTDAKIVFSEKDLAKLDGITSKTRKISLTKPAVCTKKEENCKIDVTNENQTEPLPIITNISDANADETILIDEAIDTVSEPSPSPPSAPPRKRSNNNKQPTVNIVSIPEDSVTITSPTNNNKTVVQVSSPSTMHKIKIKTESPDYTNLNQTISIFENPQRKTSILINGDDCYSTVINDNVPLYQSSVVVNDESSPMQINSTNNSSKIYITGSFSSTPSEEASVTVDCKDIEAVDVTNDSLLLLDSTSSPELIKELLRDPVEAVRHNLVPHVCGKSDMARRQRDTKFPRHTSPLGKAESLLESPLEETNLPISLEDSFLRLRNYERIGDDEDGTFSQYEPMDQGSECYTDHSNRSSITEEELANRTKFYELLTESGNIEVSESDDHHYESIKVNNDPIYEEIEMPPPLPSNPPPSAILDDLHLDKEYTTRSIFEGASKYDILSYLVDAKERGIVQEEGYTYQYSSNTNNEDDAKESYGRTCHMSTVSDSSEDNSLIISGAIIDEKATFQKPAEVERNDSGVGSETSKSSLSKYRTKPEIFVICEDCDSSLDLKAENEPLLCRKCVKKRSERKEIISEIVETEEKYARDLQIILEEFYQPMLVAGLLTPDQLSAIFLNAEELLENSQALAERLRDAVEIALEQGDDDLLTVNIGKPFLEATPMLHAFETYCVRQGTASLLLASLEKEKELLRIFLRVSQMENTLLRRMNLNSFLMVPVQRVTKYPLLLARLYKVTPAHHETRGQLKDAQHKIELHLNHMNSETKDVPSKLWRRIGNNSGRRSSAEMDLVNIKLRKIAVDVLDWNHEEARFVLEGKLLFTQPTDNNWRKGRTIKLTPVNALLVINGKTPINKPTDKIDESGLVFSMRNSGVREAALLLVRDKNGRYSLLREPLYLDRCVIATDPAWQSYFEVQELQNRDTFIFKAEDEDQTHVWYKKLQYHAQGMGTWRKRRNALANIMINGMGLRS